MEDNNYGTGSGNYSSGQESSNGGSYQQPGGYNNYQQAGGYNNYQQPGNYNNNYQDPDEVPMTTLEWLLTIFLSTIPCVGLVLLIVWAVSSSGNVNRRNYARALLVIEIVYTVLIFILYLTVFAAAFSYVRSGGTLAMLFL